MAIQGLNTTNYSGEVLENVLTLATTGNELVSRGLIMVIPGVNSAISIPRVKAGKMLQKRKEDPTKAWQQNSSSPVPAVLPPAIQILMP